jgi:hypothetical protein
MRRSGKARRRGIAALRRGGATTPQRMQRLSNADESLTRDTSMRLGFPGVQAGKEGAGPSEPRAYT